MNLILSGESPVYETGGLKEVRIPNDCSDWQSTRGRQLRAGAGRVPVRLECSGSESLPASFIPRPKHGNQFLKTLPRICVGPAIVDSQKIIQPCPFINRRYVNPLLFRSRVVPRRKRTSVRGLCRGGDPSDSFQARRIWSAVHPAQSPKGNPHRARYRSRLANACYLPERRSSRGGREGCQLPQRRSRPLARNAQLSGNRRQRLTQAGSREKSHTARFGTPPFH